MIVWCDHACQFLINMLHFDIQNQLFTPGMLAVLPDFFAVGSMTWQTTWERAAEYVQVSYYCYLTISTAQWRHLSIRGYKFSASVRNCSHRNGGHCRISYQPVTQWHEADSSLMLLKVWINCWRLCDKIWSTLRQAFVSYLANHLLRQIPNSNRTTCFILAYPQPSVSFCMTVWLRSIFVTNYCWVHERIIV